MNQSDRTIIKLLLSFFIICVSSTVYSKTDSLSIVFKADHKDWIYKTGEKQMLTVSVFNNGKPVNNLKLKYSVAPEKMPYIKSDSVIFDRNSFVLPSFSMNTPGVLRYTVTAEVNSVKIKGLITAAFSPESISPTIEIPQDFTQFW